MSPPSKSATTAEADFFKHYPQFRRGEDPIKAHDRVLFERLSSLLSVLSGVLLGDLR